MIPHLADQVRRAWHSGTIFGVVIVTVAVIAIGGWLTVILVGFPVVGVIVVGFILVVFLMDVTRRRHRD